MADLHAVAVQQLQPRATWLVDWPRCHTGCCGEAPQAGRRHKDQLSRQPSMQPLRRVRSSQSQLWLQRTLQPRAVLAPMSARPRRHALQRGRRASGCAACCPVRLPALASAVPECVTIAGQCARVVHAFGLSRRLCNGPCLLCSQQRRAQTRTMRASGAAPTSSGVAAWRQHLGPGARPPRRTSWTAPPAGVCVTNF